MILIYRRRRCRAYGQYKQTAAAPAAGPGSSKGSRPLLTDPPFQLCLLPEVAQLGCLPWPEGAQLAHSPGRNQMLSGQSNCVDSGVGQHRHVKVRMCALLFIFFARTLQNAENKKQKKKNKIVRHSRKSTRGQGPTNRSTYQRFSCFGPVSFRR